MSRKILSRGSQLKKQQQQAKLLSESYIRTFMHEDHLQLLSVTSQYQLLISSAILKNTVNKLRKVAAYRKMAYLTDVQYYYDNAYFTINRNLIANSWFHESYRTFADFDVYFNPKIVGHEGEPQPVKQLCYSFPYIVSTVDRHPTIVMQYSKITNLDEEGTSIKVEHVCEKMQGFKSIVAQHCVDHLNGKHCFTPQLTKGRLEIHDKSIKSFPNSNFLLREYNLRVKKAIEEGKCETQEFKKIKKDYEDRLGKKFTEEVQVAQKSDARNPFQKFK